MLLLQLWVWYRLPFLCPRAVYPYTFSLITRWNHELSYLGLLEKLQDIWILLDQRSEVEVKLPLVVYATMEIYESNRVMRKFGFRQTIPSTTQDIEDMHHIDLRGRRDGN
ncbi:hypothetical protein Goshw_018995 [Gossypium schwendimanii]|uniref:Aminotransferase-like plant mobile domain-containing protein n=1 Tax=Gossypium schwendimanii TaxID=34291 RepID=A0A7J9LWQ7_GOSSC|nr:hypothetical protein [Gossypium schwendimanii]